VTITAKSMVSRSTDQKILPLNTGSP
jgi:hypothetical protein